MISMPSTTHATAAVIPAFDAAGSVGAVVSGTREVLDEVLVIDDGSSDDTKEIAAAAGARVLVQPRNLGKGAGLRRAFEDLFSRGFERVVTLDADGQHLPEEIPKLLTAEPEADLLLGVRDHLFGEMGAVRRASNRLSSRAISWAAGRPLPDIQTGFRRYGRRLIETVGFPEDRFEAESAVVVRAARRGFLIAAIPVRLGYVDGRRTTHFRPLADSWRIARAVVRARAEAIHFAALHERTR